MDDSLTSAADAFQRLRPRLFGIAYRVLGSVVEAEDVVQEVWLRWQRADREAVLDPGAFLAKATTRLAINVAQSARVRREAYVGPWLPEPVDTGVDPQLGAERGEALELAVLLVMEKLNPVERAAYVLREAFDYGYGEIAQFLELSQANVRQIVSRARKRLSDGRREPVDTAQHRRLLDAFVAAARDGDVAALESVLSADVVTYADGNGLRGVAQVEVVGAERSARVTVFAHKFFPDAEYSVAEANGRPCLRLSDGGKTVALVDIATGPDGIDAMYWVIAPEKLRAYDRSRLRA
ncbi:RNA polymerase sigma factor [Streptomyces sp. NBRC 14336]|uniref:sigma-70 family RNA polymerase sigma factor n=1 Tax=Streptomyces sp. NBRC 14336 TaxID=3030992 RepID=UPI0024A1978D|nr:sigma-70 family RNA polymerase sigma factor [Streptomyces sp. NBRC 14336]GLW48948.1 RNA polymerase sigma factor [Streptomyces sp. NBRC 14336]